MINHEFFCFENCDVCPEISNELNVCLPFCKHFWLTCWYYYRFHQKINKQFLADHRVGNPGRSRLNGDSPRAGEAIRGGCKNREKPLRSQGKSRHFPISSWYLHDIYWFHLGSQFMDPQKNRKFEGKSSTLRCGRRHGLAKGEAGPVDWTMCRDLSGSVGKKRRVQSMHHFGVVG